MNASFPFAVVAVAAFLFSLTANVVVASPADRLAVRWSELHPVLKGRQLSVRLRDGATVEGRYSSLQADALSIQVTKTSDPAKHPKGAARLARPEFAEITVKRRRGWKGRTIGLIAGGAVGALVSSHDRYNAGIAAGEGAAAIGIGYVVGWLFDLAGSRPEQVVRILPDDRSR